MATSTGSSPESSCSRWMTTEVSMSPRLGWVFSSTTRACLLRGRPVEVQLPDDVLDCIDAIVAPGATINPHPPRQRVGQPRARRYGAAPLVPLSLSLTGRKPLLTEKKGATMEIKAKHPTAKGPAESFTGDVWVDAVYNGQEPSRARAGIVHFSPGRAAHGILTPSARASTSPRGPGGPRPEAAPSSTSAPATLSTPPPMRSTGMVRRPTTTWPSCL